MVQKTEKIKSYQSSASQGKIAHMRGVEIEATSLAGGEIPAPATIQNIPMPNEPVRDISTALPNLPKVQDLIKLPSDREIGKLLMTMASMLDDYVLLNYPKTVDLEVRKALHISSDGGSKELSIDEKDQIAKKVEDHVLQHYRDSLQYFITLDRKKDIMTPLERLAMVLGKFHEPEEEVLRSEFEMGVKEYLYQLIMRAFDQHFDNPEQYVSHGFDHSINVLNFTLRVYKMNPEILLKVKQKYSITEEEALFVLDNIALLHDIGYPTVGSRSKSVHGITGADLIVPLHEAFDKIILSPGANKEVLFNDFRNTILFHSADKIEHAFSAKIVSTLGTFLTEEEKIVQVLSNFYDPTKNPSHHPRYTLEIYVQNKDVKDKIIGELNIEREKIREKLGDPVNLPEFKVHEGLFKGRYADLEYNKDKMIGLEFTETDLLENPLTMIRLVDNMDMCETRLTPLQHSPAFRKIYRLLGDGGPLSQVVIALEEFEKQTDYLYKKAGSKEKKMLTKNLAETSKRTFLDQIRGISEDSAGNDKLLNDILSSINKKNIEIITTPQEARALLTEIIIDVVLAEDEYKGIPEEEKNKIRKFGMALSSIDIRHFGGCEAVKDVYLINTEIIEGKRVPKVVVVVKKELFEHLNEIKVKESTFDQNGHEQVMTVGVGEYQIWRASEAYRSITLGGLHLKLEIRDENGNNIKTSFTEPL